ncbi:hypothetical protein ACOMHN_066663 [Nucella lapillus]
MEVLLLIENEDLLVGVETSADVSSELRLAAGGKGHRVDSGRGQMTTGQSRTGLGNSQDSVVPEFTDEDLPVSETSMSE